MESLTHDLKVLLEGQLPDLKRTRELLASRGVAAEILRPSHCQTSS